MTATAAIEAKLEMSFSAKVGMSPSSSSPDAGKYETALRPQPNIRRLPKGASDAPSEERLTISAEIGEDEN